MKSLALILAAALLAGCTSRTDHGDCIGAFDDKDPKLVYKVSVLNVVLAVVFFQTIVVPVVVLANETSCPVGVKP